MTIGKIIYLYHWMSPQIRRYLYANIIVDWAMLQMIQLIKLNDDLEFTENNLMFIGNI